MFFHDKHNLSDYIILSDCIILTDVEGKVTYCDAKKQNESEVDQI